MGLLLNVLLLLLGSVATLAAFGGKTWVEGSEPLVRRVTKRGWISLSCLVLAMSLGVAKEVRADRNAAAVKRDRDEAQADLRRANAQLAQLGAQLAGTREHLSRQSQINLITALSRGSAIREGSWWIGFNGSAARADDLIAYLVSAMPEAYRDLAKVELRFHPFMGINSIVDLSREGGGLRVAHPLQRPHSPSPEAKLVSPTFLVGDQELPGVVRSSIPDAVLKQLLAHRSEEAREQARAGSQLILVQPVGAKEAQRSAAIAFRDLSRRAPIGSLALKFEKTFRDEAEARAFAGRRPALKGTGRAWEGTDFFRVEFAIPEAVAKRVAEYWRRTITESSVHLYLDDDETHLMISSKAGLDNVKTDRYEITASFHALSEPEIRVGIDKF